MHLGEPQDVPEYVLAHELLLNFDFDNLAGLI